MKPCTCWARVALHDGHCCFRPGSPEACHDGDGRAIHEAASRSRNAGAPLVAEWVEKPNGIEAMMIAQFGAEAATAALDAARKRFGECVRYACPRGCCVADIHPSAGESGGWGPVDCPHADDDGDTIRATWVLA